jgi:hypothetical protein
MNVMIESIAACRSAVGVNKAEIFYIENVVLLKKGNKKPSPNVHAFGLGSLLFFGAGNPAGRLRCREYLYPTALI